MIHTRMHIVAAVLASTAFAFTTPITRAAGLASGQRPVVPAFPQVAGATMLEMPANRCLYSRVLVRRAGQVQPWSGIEAMVLDGDPQTALACAADGTMQLEVRFFGAPRWFDRVDVTTDCTHFELEWLDIDNSWKAFAAVKNEALPTQQISVNGALVRARGLRFVPTLGSGRQPAVAQLHELSASLAKRDPDRPQAGPVGWYYAEFVDNYMGNSNDLRNCGKKARELRDQLPSNWDKTNVWGNADAWERDWGVNEQTWVDAYDLVYFDGHGWVGHPANPFLGNTRTNLLFGRQNRNDCCHVPESAAGQWGDYNMEWAAINACRVMSDAGNWFTQFNGLHQILGWRTILYNEDQFGDYFGYYLRDGAVLSGETVANAWLTAAAKTHSSYKETLQIYMIAEDSNMWLDRIHGQGNGAQADPVHDAVYYYWYRTVANPAFAQSGPGSGSAGVSLAGTPSIAAGAGGEDVVFQHADGFPVVVARSVLEQSAAATMNTYSVIPAVVDSTVVRQLANSICGTESALCGGDIGANSADEFGLADATHQLRVCSHTGAMHYDDTAHWLRWRTTPPALLSEGAARSRATQVLSGWGRLHPGAVLDRVEYLTQGANEVSGSGTSIEIPDSTFASASIVMFGRELDGFPVVGPGATLEVALGEAGAVQRVLEGAWRTVTTGPSVTTLPLQSVLNVLGERGSDATIDGITPFVYSLAVNSFELGYYEFACDEPQTSLRPVYILHCTITETPPGVVPPVTTQADVHMWADALPPRAQVTLPPDGACVAPGSTVQLGGVALDGTPPFTYEWLWGDDAVLLGTGNSLPVVLNPPARVRADADPIPVVTLTLVVRDALDRESREHITVCFGDPASVEVADLTRVFLGAPQPNPARGRIRYDLSIPASGHVRVSLFDVAGRLVTRLVDRDLRAGRQSFVWDSTEIPGLVNGVYLLQLDVAGERRTRKLLLLR